MRSRAGLVRVAVVVVLLVAGALPAARASSAGQSPALCGAQDTRETGVQGDVPRADQLSGRAEQGYNCGLAVVGHSDLNGLGATDLAWAGRCAFVKTVSGSLVTLDVSDPANPTITDTKATNGVAENIYARTTADGSRALLVVAMAPTGGAVPLPAVGGGSPTAVNVYDVKTDCTHPALLGAVEFPGNVHNIELDPSATHVYASMPVQRADITNLSAPSTWQVTNWQCDIGAQVEPAMYPKAGSLDASQEPCNVWPKGVVAGPSQIAHEFEFSADGSHMYVGDQNPYPFEQCLHLVNITASTPDVVSSLCHLDGSTGGHAIRRMAIGGHPYLLNSNETAFIGATTGALTNAVQNKGVPVGLANPGGAGANGCLSEHTNPYTGAAQAWITDIGDEGNPRTVSELKLAINDPAHCADQVQSGVNSTVHYEGVDNPDNTSFVMLPMKNAGLRVWDVRNPKAPAEVAYFNPGQYAVSNGTTVLDRARMHTYYDASTGYIWLTTETGGFWVLELEPQVRDALGLPPLPALHPNGEPARPGAVARAVVPIAVATSARNPYFC